MGPTRPPSCNTPQQLTIYVYTFLQGVSALHCAVRANALINVQRLLERGAIPNSVQVKSYLFPFNTFFVTSPVKVSKEFYLMSVG